MSGIDGSGSSNGEPRTPVCDDQPAGNAVPGGGRAARLTPTQRDLYIHEVVNPGSTMFNIGVSVNLGTGEDTAQWTQAVTWVARRDDIAAICFVTHHGEAIQCVVPDHPVFYVYVDLLDDAGEARTPEHYLTEQSEHQFNLTQTPLLRNYIVKGRDGSYTAAVRGATGFRFAARTRWP